MSSFEVPEPILNSPYAEPTAYWYIREGQDAQKRDGRRPSIVYPPREGKADWSLGEALAPSVDFNPGYELPLVNRIRERVKAWRDEVLRTKTGVTRTTLELMQHWRREGREQRLFFAQLEAAETIIFLNEARGDYLQGVGVPIDEPSDEQKAQNVRAFIRYACKMATGSGKTTVMGMLAAWSILNKVNDRGNARYSDVVLVVCPNVTIKNRLLELNPNNGDASLYRTRDLVPAHLMPLLTQGKVLVTNWHVFDKQQMQVGGESARVAKVGVEEKRPETIRIGDKTTTARGTRYLTEEDYCRQVNLGLLRVIEELRDDEGLLEKVRVESTRWVESDTAWMNRVLGQEIGGKQNILIFNDEAHHAYRIRREADEDEESEEFGETEEAEEFFQEATIWIDGLDRIHRLRGINFCVDLSATPYFLGRVGQETNKPFPWVVSDFSLTDAIESGLVKIPQLAVRDTSGQVIGSSDTGGVPAYFNIWRWLMPKLTPAERGGKRGNPKPEAILKYAHTPVALMGGLWEQTYESWKTHEEQRPPVFIVVCKNTKIAKVVYEWLAEDTQPTGIAPARLDEFTNRYDSDGRAIEINTIRVDTKVVHDTDTDGAKADEVRWMRLTLDTVGKTTWPADRQDRPIFPEGFADLAEKLNRPLHPPGRDIRCIVSVGMLTEGWDCNTVTHIVGLRPFMSQLLCEQVVGRGLRRASYKPNDDGKLPEEVAKIFGVPFEVIPFKADPQGGGKPPEKRHHVHAVPGKAKFKITFPRVDGYAQVVRNRITVDWDKEARVPLDPMNIPPEVQMKGGMNRADGRPSLSGPGKLESVDLNPYRKGRRFQELVFELAASLSRSYVATGRCEVPAQALFPQLAKIVDRFLREKIIVIPPAQLIDVFCSPYYGWAIERLTEAIRPDVSSGEAPEVPRYEPNREPGSTGEVDFWTSREVREVTRSHLNYVVADTRRWEQSAAYYIDTHNRTQAFVKNAGLGFAIPYVHNGEPHDYVPDFIVRVSAEDEPLNLILETKGYDPLADVKRAAAERWVNAVNADGKHGPWRFRMVTRPEEVRSTLDSLA
jgi:type III restriction enzyme